MPLLMGTLVLALTGAKQRDAAAPDTISLTDGEQLIGKLVRVLNGSVTFHSNILGDLSIPVAKVKSLHAAQFAVVAKDQHVTRRTALQQIPAGTVDLEDNAVRVVPDRAPNSSFAPAISETRSVSVSDLGSVVDADTFNREIRGESRFFYGWKGSVTLGASLVDSTNTAQTYTGAVSFVRSIPTVAWLPPDSKTSLNLSGTYGLAKDPQIVSGNTVLQTASTSKTEILHGDSEYDKYFSHAIFGVASASADHNYGNGLQLQQAYGGGIGWAVRNNPTSVLNVKAQLQYEQQQFYNGLTSGLGTPDENLVGLALNENWQCTFKNNVKLNEFVTLTPTFNVVQAYSATANANLIIPVYKRFNFTLSPSDTYLGDPPEGYLRNSFQFTAGVTYVIK